MDLQALITKIPIFGNIKPKMMQALLEEVSFRTVKAGEVMVRQGEYTEDLLLVLEGIATGYRSEPGGSIENVGSFGVNEWFGEMTALSNQPSFATVKSETPCTLLVVTAPLFKKLYTGGGSFKDLVDKVYRERALSIHLRTAPIFKGVKRAGLKLLAREAKLETVAGGKAIVESGKPADAVYLVRSGIVKEVRTVDGKEEILAYHRDNSSFGERTFAADNTWRTSFFAVTDVDVVKLAKGAFEVLAQGDPDSRTRMQATALALVAESEGFTSSSAETPMVDLSRTAAIDIMLGKKVVQGGEALVIDLHKCTRCNACVEACVSVHEDRVPRLSKRGIRTGDLMLTSACYNCKVPECMMGCNYGAIRRDVNGAIHFIFDNCTGCSACEVKCPYGVIRMAAIGQPEEEEEEKRSFFSKLLPFLFKRKEAAPVSSADPAIEGAAPAAKAEKVEKKAIKCDLCEGLPFEACVYNCPCGAISRVDPELILGTPAFKV